MCLYSQMCLTILFNSIVNTCANIVFFINMMSMKMRKMPPNGRGRLYDSTACEKLNDTMEQSRYIS